MDPRDAHAAREMTPGEKLMAQWEAQHDVAARGPRCDPLGVQHQLSRARVAERTHARPQGGARGAGATSSGATPSGAAPQPRAAEPRATETRSEEGVPAAEPRARRHPWLHRLTGRR